MVESERNSSTATPKRLADCSPPPQKSINLQGTRQQLDGCSPTNLVQAVVRHVLLLDDLDCHLNLGELVASQSHLGKVASSYRLRV